MKASFLAFGVLIYILPTICQKVFDLQNPANDKDYVYLQTIKTLGATNWQKFIYVYWPYVIGRVFTELIALTAITYTYTVICEGLNKTSGVGAMISTMSRQSRTAEVYALLFIIVLIGITQDFLLKKADKAMFPYKYN
jgi:NitT/TauT family transport system permease protein